MPADVNFMRRYVMRFGKQGKNGFEIGNIRSARETALHISFSVEKSDAEDPNDAQVQIWNLSDKSLKVLDEKKCVIELKAGYGENMAVILTGTVTSAITTQENADRMTEIAVADGMVELRDTNLSLSLNGKVNTKTVYKRIAKEMGVPIVFAKDLSFKKFPHGFRYVGKAKGALQKVAGYCGHKWSIQNGVLQVTLPGRAVSARAYLLSSDTGLIGIPKRITIGSDDDAQTGWEVEYFLNGAIGINDVVQLKSSNASGYFRVYKVTIDGDNVEGDWICTAQLLRIKNQSKLDKKTRK